VTGLDNEGADHIKMKNCTLKTNKILLSAIALLLCIMLKQNFIVSNSTSALHHAEFWPLVVCSMRAGVSNKWVLLRGNA
jgi:hypothetical protein